MASILVLTRQMTAVGYYRHRVPARILTRLGHDVLYSEERSYKGWMLPDPLTWFRSNIGRFDLVMADRCFTPESLEEIRAFVYYSGDKCKLITDFDDDYQRVPPWNFGSSRYSRASNYRIAGDASVKLSELTTVSTEVLARRFAPMAHKILVAKNLIDPRDWTNFPVNPNRGSDRTVRILYGGASGHYGDLDEARPGIESFLRNPPCPVRFIVLGTCPPWLHDISKEFPGRVIVLPWVDFSFYPQVVAWGGFDACIAPLAEHPFNHAKSNIKWLEAGIQKIPLICSSIGPYDKIPSDCAMKVKNKSSEWKEALTAIATDPDLRNAIRSRAYSAVMDGGWTAADGTEMWQNIVETALAAPRVEELLARASGPPSACDEATTEGPCLTQSPSSQSPTSPSSA